MAINLAGYLFSDNGTAIQNASITLLDSSGNTEDTVSTSGTGYWSFSEADEDVYDIKIQSGSQIRYIKGLDKITLSEIDVRNSAANSTGAFTFTNSTNNASNKVGTFRNLNSTRADGDEIYLSFNLMNDNAEETEFARITAEANDVSNGSEDGEIRFSVMKAGTLTEVWNLNSSTAGATSMDMNVDSFTIGTGTAATDITLTFDAETNDGVITWMEDEEYFAFSDEILMNTTEKIHLRDTAIYINSSTDGQLDLVADTEIQIAATTIDINGAVALDGAITGATNITLSGELDAATLDLSSSADIAGDLVLSGGADGALQFTNAGENSIKIPDNQASALIIEEANNAYITFVTTNGSEAITVAKGTTFSAGITNAGTVAAGTWNGTAIASAYIADNAITNAKMADDAIDSAEIANGAVDLAHMSSQSVDEDNLYISNSGSDGQFLSKQSGNSGGLTWATPSTVASTVTVTDSTSNTNFPVVFHDESNGLLDDTGALRYNPSTGELLVPKLTVAGTTTTVDTVTMNAQNAIVFEGATADTNETILSIVDPTSDHTQYLINQGGYVPLLAAVTTTAISSTPEELNILDGATVVVGEINALDLGSTAVGTAIASKAVILDSNKDYTGLRNFTITGELDAATLDISGDADIDGTLEADAYTVDGTALNEYIADTVGAMVSSNTESGITVAYQDADNTLDFTIGTLNQDTTGTAAIATTVTITDNESTNEDNAIIFTAGGDVDGGNLGLESDGTLTYNPSTGKITATGFIGAIDGILGANSAAALTATTGVFSTSIDVTGSTGIILENDETITNSVNGTVLINGNLKVGSGSAAGVYASNGNYDVTLQTGNSTTGSITIVDGANGTITLSPNGTGTSVIEDPVLTVGSDADGDIYYRASNKLARLANGSDGQVLTSTGGTSAPAWEDAAGGGGSATLEVASGKTITPGMAVGVDSSGKAVPFLQDGADYTHMIDYQPETTKYVQNMQVGYDTETDLHVAVYTKTTTANVNETDAIYAVAFSVDADDNITFGTERTIAAQQVMYGRVTLEYMATKNQFLVAFPRGDGSNTMQDITGYLLKPVAGSPTTINVSTALALGAGTDSKSYAPGIADASDGSDHRMVVSYQGASYYPKARVLNFASDWDEGHGNAHNVTIGSETNLYSSASYYRPAVAWMHQDNSGNNGTQIVAYHYNYVFGFDIGSGGTTINTITTGNHSASTRAGMDIAWVGTAGEAHVFVQAYSSYNTMIRVSISASDNSTSQGSSGNGIYNSVGSGASQGGYWTNVEYYGTTDKFVAIHKRNYTATQYYAGAPGNDDWHGSEMEFQAFYYHDGGDGGNKLYGGGSSDAPGLAADYAKCVVNPLQGNNSFSNIQEGQSTCYNPDRNRIIVAVQYGAHDSSNQAPFSNGRRGQGIYMIKSNSDFDDHGTLPEFIGFSNAASNVTGGSNVELTITGGTNSRQSSLTVGVKYFLDSFGKLNPYGPLPVSRANIFAGVALSATELLVDGNAASAPYYKHK